MQGKESPLRFLLILTVAVLLAVSPILSRRTAHAADHRDSPVIAASPSGDISDVFAFLEPNDSKRLTLAMGVNPFSVPALANTYLFSNQFLYQFKIDVDGDYREDIVIQWQFDNTDSGQTVRVYLGNPGQVGAINYLLPSDPVIQGPTGGILGDPSGVQIFTGPRDDPFVMDGQFFRIKSGAQEVFRNLPTTSIGPLRGRPVRTDGSSGVDAFAGFNASYFILSVPVDSLNAPGNRINIWGTVSAPLPDGTYAQFERMGQALFSTLFITDNMKDAYNASVPADDVQLWSPYVPDALTTTDNDGSGNTIAGRGNWLTGLGVAALPGGAPLFFRGAFPNTSRDYLRNMWLPDVMRFDLSLHANNANDLATAQFGLENGRRPGDAVFDEAARIIRELADVNFAPTTKIPGSGSPRPGALTFPDWRFLAALQGTDFIRPNTTLPSLTTSGNDKPSLSMFPFFPPPHSLPGDATSIGFPCPQQ